MIFHPTTNGVLLNFRVVYGTTTPSSALENDLWLNTEIPIDGYAFCSEAPSQPEEGMAWISVGTDSVLGFSAVKPGIIFVYPVGAKQYIGGEWVVKDLYVYQNGMWRQNELYVFNAGETYDAVTGGWSPDGYYGSAVQNTKAYLSDTQIVCGTRSGSGSNYDGVIGTNLPVQISGKKTLIAKGTVNNYKSSSVYSIGLVAEKGNVSNAAAETKITRVGAFDVKVDVSELNGAYYVFAGAMTGSAQETYDSEMRIDLIAFQ